MIWVRSAIFFAGMAVSAILFCPVALLSWPVPPVSRMRIIGLWARFVCWWRSPQVTASHQQTKRAHRPIIRIRETGGTGQESKATGQNRMAETAMPAKKMAERTQIIGQ